MVAFALLVDGLQVERGNAEGLGAGFGRGVQFGREDPLVGPLEDARVRGACVGVVVLRGDVEREVEERVGVGFDEGGEPFWLWLALLPLYSVDWGERKTYAMLSALSLSLKPSSKSHDPCEYCRR